MDPTGTSHTAVSIYLKGSNAQNRLPSSQDKYSGVYSRLFRGVFVEDLTSLLDRCADSISASYFVLVTVIREQEIH